ncbi:GntR family transcriptional regulator [Caballeronia sp. LP006]|uniref:GntR family transcriptional regulator n=1 Tax=Caballeronia sp. LP006 TaxID=3038552 RepID=UPI0028643ABB|nr:GntR family transcriptional regulator [Caballeronia sp. LP006]MDR5826985.1 GntR family transcriptional regulator [Caballeronia sp. LP006]
MPKLKTAAAKTPGRIVSRKTSAQAALVSSDDPSQSILDAAEPVAAESSMSQTDSAVNAIRSRIIDLTISPGSRIDEPMLLNDFMLGRTPAREAINRLVAEGFVNIVPNRGGTFVRRLDFEEIGEILVAHQLAENILAQMMRFEPGLAEDLTTIQTQYVTQVQARAFLNITALNEKFHMRMNQAVGNGFFYEFAQSTHRHVRRLLVHLYKMEAESTPEEQDLQFDRNLREHDKIIDIVKRKDRAALVKYLPAHARATQDRFVHLLKSRNAPPFDLNVKQFP